MNITIAYTGQLAAAAGEAEECLDLEGGINLESMLSDLAQRHGGKFAELLFDDKGALRSTLLIALGGEQVTAPAKSVVLSEGASLMLMTPIAGG